MRSVLLSLSLASAALACSHATRDVEPEAPPPPSKPSPMAMPETRAEAIAAYKARVWVDQDARKTPDWKARIEKTLERANEYIGPAFGVKLEWEVKEWQRQAGAADLMPILRELASADAGADVDWVIGVTAPAPSPETAHHRLGLAAVPGRHVLVRAINDPVKPDLLSHKELVVFLHEWGHSAGALHEIETDSIMNLAYDPRSAGFSPATVEMVRLGVQIRSAERGGDSARAAELWERFSDILGKAKGYAEEEKAPLLDRAIKLAAKRGGAGSLSAEDRAAFDAAAEGAKNGDRVAAMKAIDSLLAKHPDDASLRAAAAAVYANAGAFSKAEAMVTDPAARARLVAARRFYGLPPDSTRFKVTPDNEPEYVTMFEAAHDALSKKMSKDLAQRASDALRKFPGAPGLLALACAANFQFKRLPKAKAQCADALAAWDQTVLAHFFAGQIDKGPEGTKHLEKVLELDPSLEPQVKPLLEKRKK